MTWRRATRENIYRYYAEEFPSYLNQLPPFITAEGPKQYAIAFREPHPVRTNDAPAKSFIRRDTWRTDRSGSRSAAVFRDFEEVVEFIRHPARNDPLGDRPYGLADPDILEKPGPYPDAVYYALDNWRRPWVLLIDIDAKTIAKERVRDSNEEGGPENEDRSDLESSGVLDADPSGYPYTFADIDRAIEYGFELCDILKSDFDATETMVLYTGQGVHVYLLDTDRAHRYDAKSREVLNDLLLDTYEIPIDPVVTADRRRVARLPYSLHTDVCRVVQPIESPSFDARAATPESIEL